MNKGVLIFAFNNTKLDYFKQAVWVADRVDKFLGLPTTIITDDNSYKETRHNTICIEAEIMSKRNFDVSQDDQVDHWYNANRFQAYNLSPYNETIVIDSDYIVNSEQLNLLFSSPHDFLCHRDVYDVAAKNSLVEHQTFGSTKMPHYWATVLFFRKSEFAEQMFETITMIKENYKFYSKLYKFNPNPFRNDFAVSIAMSIMYGHRINSIPTIPWKLPTAVTDITTTQINDTTFKLLYNKRYRNKVRTMSTIIKDHDFHCFNKVALEQMIND